MKKFIETVSIAGNIGIITFLFTITFLIYVASLSLLPHHLSSKKKGFLSWTFTSITFLLCFSGKLHMLKMITLGTRQKQILNKQASVGADRFEKRIFLKLDDFKDLLKIYFSKISHARIIFIKTKVILFVGIFFDEDIFHTEYFPIFDSVFLNFAKSQRTKPTKHPQFPCFSLHDGRRAS